MATRTSPGIGEGYVPWRAFHCIVWPLAVGGLLVSWQLNRAATADIQKSLDRVLATQQVLLERLLEAEP